ncbi:hypothetical protein ACS126_03245 [Sphingobacterium lactis]|uniref:hypothetical protein n=1 Tax=Sphingobacterium TaxID=28453 RepID=UPI0021A2EABA|nr:hypothetical protein [Sphingobacterium hotanense]MCT1525831.1 hypothetical protein [Sphingobacterium hotanense]
MSKKIHSDPQDLEKVEEKSEGAVNEMLSNRMKMFKSFIESRPKTVYACMVGSIALSAIIAFTVMKPPKQPVKTGDPSVASLVTTGFGNLASTATAFGDLLELQAAINGLLDKDSLTMADSLLLDSTLTRMQQIENQMKALNSTNPKNNMQDED